jgi:hypothetical protein
MADTYCTYDDILDKRPALKNNNGGPFQDQLKEAKVLVDEDLELYWYRPAADKRDIDWSESDYAFDPTSLISQTGSTTDSTKRVKRLAVLKSLQLIYEYLSKDSKDDNYLAMSDRFKDQYNAELNRVVKAGLDYDWDDDDTLEDTEKAAKPRGRRLVRI